MNPVTTRVSPHDHQQVTFTTGSGSDQLIFFTNAQTQAIHQRVTRIPVGQKHLAAHTGYAQAVAIVGKTSDNSIEQATIIRFRQRTKAKRVEQSYRAGTHGKDIPYDAACCCGRTLIRVNRRGVVVGLYLHYGHLSIADIHHPGIFFPRPHQDILASGWEKLE